MKGWISTPKPLAGAPPASKPAQNLRSQPHGSRRALSLWCWAMATRGGRAETEFGINGGSSGKDGVITLGDHALVFSKLRRVTCGVAVHKAVDNRCDVRITGGILWTRCGHERNLKRIPVGSCATRAKGVEILSPQETGTIPGVPPGAMERPGNRNLQRVSGTGGRRVALGSPGSRTNRMASPGNWVNRTGRLDNRANRNSEAGRPADLGR